MDNFFIIYDRYADWLMLKSVTILDNTSFFSGSYLIQACLVTILYAYRLSLVYLFFSSNDSIPGQSYLAILKVWFIKENAR